MTLDQVNVVIDGLNSHFALHGSDPSPTLAEQDALQIARAKAGAKGRTSLIAACTFKKLIITYDEEGEKGFKKA